MKIENVFPFEVIYMRRKGEFGEENRYVMENFKKYLEKNGLFDDKTVILGVSRYNPEPEKCCYDVCKTVNEHIEITDDNIHKGIIEGGKYMVFEIPHTKEGIEKAWAEIPYEVEKNGFVQDMKKPFIERYNMNLIKNHLCELCIPVC